MNRNIKIRYKGIKSYRIFKIKIQNNQNPVQQEKQLEFFYRISIILYNKYILTHRTQGYFTIKTVLINLLIQFKNLHRDIINKTYKNMKYTRKSNISNNILGHDTINHKIQHTIMAQKFKLIVYIAQIHQNPKIET